MIYEKLPAKFFCQEFNEEDDVLDYDEDEMSVPEKEDPEFEGEFDKDEGWNEEEIE